MSGETLIECASLLFNVMAFFGVDRWENLSRSPQGRFMRRTLKWLFLAGTLGVFLWMISDQRFGVVQIVVPMAIAAFGIALFGELGRRIGGGSLLVVVLWCLAGGGLTGWLLHAGVFGVVIFAAFGAAGGGVLYLSEREVERRAAVTASGVPPT